MSLDTTSIGIVVAPIGRFLRLYSLPFVTGCPYTVMDTVESADVGVIAISVVLLGISSVYSVAAVSNVGESVNALLALSAAVNDDNPGFLVTVKLYVVVTAPSNDLTTIGMIVVPTGRLIFEDACPLDVALPFTVIETDDSNEVGVI